MINNGMSWLSLGNYINPKARNTELSNDYNQLTNRPIITLTGTSQNPIKLWKLDVGLYILNGYVQHTDALLSEARGLFVSATVGIVNGKYVISAFIPFWEGQYEYILPSLSSETYTEHQMIRMITQGNSLTLDNIREYTPSEEYHPSTKKYVDDTIEIMRNELGKMGLNNNDIQSLMKENRRRDIAIQALLSQNSDKMVTIDEEVHNISMDYSLDEGIATINTLEGDTLVNVSKDTEYDKILSYEQDIVENTNTVDLEVDGNLNPIIVGDTLVNVCTQNNPTAITNEYTVEGNNHFALQDEVEGNCRPIIQGNTIVNRSKTKDNTPLTTYVSEVEGNEMSLVDDTDTHVRIDKLVGDTMVSPMGSCYGILDSMSIHPLENGRIQGLLKNGNYYIKKENGELCKTKPNTIYTVILDGTIECTDNVLVKLFYRINNETTKSISDFYMENNLYINKIATFTSKNEDTFGFYFLDYDKVTNIDIKYIILEGDYTNKPIPQEYFEGLKNSYEDGYIPNNLFTSDMQIGDISSLGVLGNNLDRIRTTSFIKVEPSTIYTIDYDSTFIPTINTIYFYDESKTFISYYDQSLVFTTPNNAYYIHFKHQGSSLNDTYNYRLLEGDYSSNPSTYEEVMEHSGQYRCEVEVQGKNKLDLDIFKTMDGWVESAYDYYELQLKPNTTYIISQNSGKTSAAGIGFCNISTSNIYSEFANNDSIPTIWLIHNSQDELSQIITTDDSGILYINHYKHLDYLESNYNEVYNLLLSKNIQIEEGSTATAYEPYYNQTQTVYLNSPLLKGDEVVYKEGKLCHYHKMGKVVLDGSEELSDRSGAFPSDITYLACVSSVFNGKTMSIILSNNFSKITNSELGKDVEGMMISTNGTSTGLYLQISKSKLTESNVYGVKRWLQENPTTVVYELATPYYETISTSELLLPITTNCKLLTSSNIPLTTMSTKVFTEEVNILANTQYSLNFNSDVASTVNITLGGTVLSNQTIVKGYNKFSITTPSTLVNSLLIIEGSGVNISEVVVTEYDEGVCEYIEGLKSSFEDGWIPPKNLLNDYEVIKSSNSTHQYSRVAVKPNTIYTLFYPSLITEGCNNVYGVYNTEGTSALLTFSVSKSPRTFNTGNREAINVYGRLKRSNGNLVIHTDPESLDDNWNKGLALFEGDWTHLHLTEEDLNHLGQYKVEYKVVGKNKFNPNSIKVWKTTCALHWAMVDIVLNLQVSEVLLTCFNCNILIKANRRYTLSHNGNKSLIGSYGWGLWKVGETTWINQNELKEDTLCDFVIYVNNNSLNNELIVYPQIEEGTVATEYEPYKESIQTVYLNSPLLEGDTIEEIDGEVYHVHRYYRTILNGNEYWCENSYTEQHENKTYIARYSSYAITPKIKSYGYIKCDKVTGRKSSSINYPSANDLMHDNWAWYLILSKNKLSTPDTKGFKQWLSENPITVVYRLAEPIYELIPSSSIVCKSYPNGHLDFDTNVHINNTVNFVKANLPITYANTSTNYKLQFVSNKDMENVTINALGNIMENVTITKGLNKISFTSPSDATNILTFEGLGYAYISDVQLVATDKDIDYFKGLYSTYECGLIEDESNENYGKYEVNIVSYNAPIQFGKGGKIE